MEKAEETWTASVHFNLEISRTDRATLEELYDIIQQHPGSSRAYLHLRSPENTDSIIELPDLPNLKAGAALTRAVNGILGYNVVETRCSSAKASAATNGFNGNRW
jgi:DNA polymerase-3 subunit alpha